MSSSRAQPGTIHERPNLAAPALIALAVLAVHLLTIGNYGLFRDEFYYLACGRHLAWGYVDHPPLVAAVAFVSTWLLGESPLAIRLFSLICGVGTVLVTGALVGRLGGGRFGQVIACLSVAVAPQYLNVFHILSMNSIEIFLWTLGGYLAVVGIQDEWHTAWLAFGVVCGIGLLNKHSMLVFGTGITVGVLLSRARRSLATPWPWAGAAIAALIFLPHILWQVNHGWPTLEFIRNAQQEKIARLAPAAFLAEQVGTMNPVTLPIWLVGLTTCFWPGRRPEWRMLGWCYLVVLGVFIAQRSKPYYVTPIYTLLFACGGVVIGRWISRFGRARHAIPAALIAGGVVVAPLAIPVLSIDRLIAYQATLGVTPASDERHEMGRLPQYYADRFGWRELAQAISAVYLSLPEPERSTARVFARNYGEAGALEYYRGVYPLPEVICPHNNYWYWGPGPDGGTLIVIGGDLPDLQRAFEHVELAGQTRCQHCMPYENGRPIYVGRGWKVSLNAIWPRERDFI
jgi:Dolichyl-phosphate-mannose-protein mannosyltransferase